MPQSLTTEGLSTLVILAAAVVFFLTNRARTDVVALLVLVSLGVSKVLTPQEMFAGFSGSAVITIVAIFVMAQGLFLTGVSARVGDLMVRISGASERRLIVVVMVAGSFLSLFMNNIAAASVLLPAVSGTAHRKGVYPSRLLMPLAFATILGGMATLFTTVNIIMSNLLRDRGLAGFGLLDFAPVGICVVTAGIGFMLLGGYKLLPSQSQAERLAASRADEPDLTQVYRLGEGLFRARIPPGSYLDGTPLATSLFRERYNLNVVALDRNARTVLAPPPETVLRAGDVLVLQGSLEEFRARDVEPLLEILPERSFRASDLESADVVVAEILVSPRSSLIGQTLGEINFRSKYGFTVLAIWREGRPIRHGMAGFGLRFGDALLIQGPRQRLRVLHSERDLILLSSEHERPHVVRPGKFGFAAAIMAGSLLAAATGLLPAAEAMVAGGLLMILSGCISVDEAYATVEWKSVILVAGMLAMALALTKTGVAAMAADAAARAAGSYGPLAILSGLFVLGTLMTQVLGGPAVAAILGPIAIQTAERTGLDPRSLAMGVALATSMAFFTPLAHPVNILVMAPGGYTFRDYLRVGIPLTLVITLVVLATLPIFWPLVR